MTLPAPRGLTDETCRKARRHLMRVDPVIAELARHFGACPLGERTAEPPLRAIVRALVSQQLSVKAAETIFRRFLALFPGDGFPAPADILALPAERLHEVGLSRPKGRYLRDLCERLQSGLLPLDRLGSMPDEEVIRVLTEVKGIGQWTAEMILIFQLGRPDVLPLDDVGLLRAIQRADRGTVAALPLGRLLVPVGEPGRVAGLLGNCLPGQVGDCQRESCQTENCQIDNCQVSPA